MATKNASGHQGEVKDPEHDGRLKGHKGGEAAKAHADGSHTAEKDHAGTTKAGTKAEGGADHAAAADHGKAKAADAKAAGAKAAGTKSTEHKPHDTKAHDTKPADDKGSDDADLKSREYTDAQGNVHHHTKAYMDSHKGS